MTMSFNNTPSAVFAQETPLQGYMVELGFTELGHFSSIVGKGVRASNPTMALRIVLRNTQESILLMTERAIVSEKDISSQGTSFFFNEKETSALMPVEIEFVDCELCCRPTDSADGLCSSCRSGKSGF